MTLLYMVLLKLVACSLLLGNLACTGSPFLAVRCCQSDADSALVNLEPQAALLVIVGLLAQLRELGGIG